MSKKRILKIILKICLTILLSLILVITGYLGYVLLSYSRIEVNLPHTPTSINSDE